MKLHKIVHIAGGLLFFASLIATFLLWTWWLLPAGIVCAGILEILSRQLDPKEHKQFD